MSDQPRIEQLEAATLRLAEQVSGLSVALTTVNDIQARQTRMEKQIVPRAEHEQSVRAQTEAMVEGRQQVLHRVYGWLGLGLIAVVVVVLASVNYAQGYAAKQHRYQQQLTGVCEARNKQAGVIRQLLDRSAQEIAALPDGPDKQERADSLTMLRTAFPTVTCPNPEEAR